MTKFSNLIACISIDIELLLRDYTSLILEILRRLKNSYCIINFNSGYILEK